MQKNISLVEHEIGFTQNTQSHELVPLAAEMMKTTQFIMVPLARRCTLKSHLALLQLTITNNGAWLLQTFIALKDKSSWEEESIIKTCN